MTNESFYVYMLKDPRGPRAVPFYVGKGIGVRAYEHALRVDATSKGRRIKEIQGAGKEVLVTIVAGELSENQALKLEAELISAFGIEATGGSLTNSVIPSGKEKPAKDLVIPSGGYEKAQLGLSFLKAAILELAKANPKGITNSDAVKAFGLQSDYKGGSKDYLVWSVLGILMREGKMKRVDPGKRHVAQVE